MKSRMKIIPTLLLVAAICLSLVACGKDLTEKRNKVVSEFNSIFDMMEENTARINEAIENDLVLAQEAVDNYNNNVVKQVEELGSEINKEINNLAEEELDEMLEILAGLKVDVATEFGKIEGFLTQQG